MIKNLQKTLIAVVFSTVLTATAVPNITTPVILAKSSTSVVYITETGKRYHASKKCRGLNNANAIYDATVDEAKNLGLTKCKICWK